tara:strand:+ start:19 stop:189 length:171 start_codon:yes stop_codon:yes gene_type:complete
MSEYNVRVICDYSRLPNTKEKEKLDNKFKNDELSTFDFYVKAKKYLEKHKQNEVIE